MDAIVMFIESDYYFMSLYIFLLIVCFILLIEWGKTIDLCKRAIKGEELLLEINGELLQKLEKKNNQINALYTQIAHRNQKLRDNGINMDKMKNKFGVE